MKQILISNLAQTPWFYIFLKIFIFEKSHSLYKLIFKAAQL